MSFYEVVVMGTWIRSRSVEVAYALIVVLIYFTNYHLVLHGPGYYVIIRCS